MSEHLDDAEWVRLDGLRQLAWDRAHALWLTRAPSDTDSAAFSEWTRAYVTIHMVWMRLEDDLAYLHRLHGWEPAESLGDPTFR